MKIAHKLLLSFLTIVSLIWVVGYLGISTGQEALKAQIAKSSVLFATEILKDVDKSIYSKIELFQEYSRDLTLQQMVSKSNRTFEKIDNIQAYITQKDLEWTSVPKETITPFMQQLMNNRLSKGLIEKARFYDIKRGFKAFGEIFVTNKYGANVAQTGKTTDYRQDDELWWQKAKTDGVTVSDIEYDESAGIHSADIAIRIDDIHGNFIGVIKVVVNVEEVIETVKTAEKKLGYQTARLYLMDKQGKEIYCQRHEFLKDLSSHLPFFKIVGDQGYFTSQETGNGEDKSLYAYAVLKDYKEFKSWDWILLIEYETEEIFAPIFQFRKNIFIIALAVTVFAVLMSLFISRHISNPITKLKSAAIAVGRGNLDIEIKAESNDEIGQLAESFNKMVEDLKVSTTSIDALNTEIIEREQAEEALRKRTYELNKRVKELHCLFGISKLVENSQSSLSDIFQGVVEFIPSSLQYPEITCACIVIGDQAYKTQNFKKTAWRLANDIFVNNQRFGVVEVYYLEEKPKMAEGPFMKEEKYLVKTIAERLGHICERYTAREEKKQYEAQLLQSEKMASIGQLAAGVAHEINNPTGFVSSNLKTLSEYIKDISDLTIAYRNLVEKLKQDADDSSRADVAERVKRIADLEDEFDIDFILNDIQELIGESRDGTERIRVIIQDLKDFAHPGEIKPKFADINHNLDSTVNVVWNELKYKAEVIKDYGELPQVHCYPQMLNQVFMNLLVNAAQAIEKRGEIRIQTRADNGYVSVKISDTGCGIPEKNLPRIFDPFFTTKEVGKGTGLGMHVAYNIIKKHHGEISLDSRVGKGTTFTITIPVT